MISTYGQICPVVFGVGSLSTLGERVKELGGTKACCIYDQGVKMAGIADKVLAVLKEHHIDGSTYEGIQADPKDTIVDEAARYAKEAGADIIIGIGGGSSLDAAKAVAVLMKNPGNIGEYYAGTGKAFTETMPLILLPTASGTGSEVTPMAVITDTKNQVKQTILNHADIAVVDPELTKSVPPHVTASTGFDALSHAVEAYTANSSYANPMSDVLALKAMKLISQNLEKACIDGNDIEARTNLSMGSNFAGIAFSGASVHFGHAAAHEMGTQFHIAHGALCALTLPEVIEFSAELIPGRIRDISEAVGADISEEMSAKEAGQQVAAVIRERMRRVKIKALREYGLTKEQVLACAEGAVHNNWFIACAPGQVDVSTMKEILERVYDNY